MRRADNRVKAQRDSLPRCRRAPAGARFQVRIIRRGRELPGAALLEGGEVIVDTTCRTTGTTNATTQGNGGASPATGTQNMPKAGEAMPDGVASLFAAISPVAQPDALPPPEGIKPVVAKPVP